MTCCMGLLRWKGRSARELVLFSVALGDKTVSPVMSLDVMPVGLIKIIVRNTVSHTSVFAA